MAKKNNPSKLGEILKKITKKSIQDEAIKERAKSYDVRKIFEQMELDLISSMHRAFYFHQSEQAKEGFEWEQWQLTKLREMEKYRKRNKDIVDSYSKPIQQAIDRELRGNYSKGQNRFKTFLDKVKGFFGWKSKSYSSIEFPEDIQEVQTVREYIHKELGRPGAVPQETNFFGVNDKKLEALIETVNKDLNKAQYSVLRKMDDVYRQTIFKSHMYLQNGVKTLPQAIDMATKDFLAKGIDSITYKNGARVNIASYAEMCLRTANHRATLLGEGKKRDEYGIYTVVVSAHANTCKMCEPWQGKVLIDDVFSHGTKLDGDYPLLSEAVTAGLLHPNCRHSITTFFPGITNLPKVPDGKKAIKLYEAEQKQRYLERQIRKWKRIESGSVDAKNVNNASNKVKYFKSELRKLLEDKKLLKRNYNREQPVGTVANKPKESILNNRKWLKANFSTQKKFDKHIEKHLKEYGDITPEDYVNIARDLLAAPLSNDIEGFISKDGFLFKYKISTNDFTIGRPDGKISTLYKPIKGYDQWLEEIEKYKGD
ncbi:phage minor capsid protein [Clostridium paraputrificum]|uniref:phage minor capsid protein n=2 Tax=Clostridium paraputrificum TaxID=29363 RepID=UPI0024808B75|nr:phage minor capsid protein [Clostridium paraputrificum]MDB2085859.1 capsid protein [Clostridium paraputrificum]